MVLLQTRLGLLLQRSGNPESAAVAFRKVVALTPNDPEAYNNLGLALMQYGQGPAAVKEFQHALQAASR